MTFIHLRNHTEYSLCQGAIKILDFAEKAKELGMLAVGLSDSGNLCGALEFSTTFAKEGIQPIIGCEVLIDAGHYITSLTAQSNLDKEKNLCKLILIASTDKGYKNLMALISESFLQREPGITPHIKIDSLHEKSEGLIALSGGYEGVLGRMILTNQYEKIPSYINEMNEIFPNSFYIELMRHGIKEERATEKDFINIAYKHNLPLVATNDCYFLTKDMYEAQDVLSCIGTGRYIIESDRKRLTPEHYFKSQEEMIALFSDIPEAVENTINIAKRCSTMAHPRKSTLPHFQLPEGVTESEQLKKECEIGLEQRLQMKFKIEGIEDEEKQEEIRKKYRERMDYELEIIISMDFSGYFLIVADFIVWSKKNDIPVGPGRGSGAGSVVAWAMKITDLDPIRFGLFFERFLNPERISMPDFDIDFCQRGRGEVIKYVQEKYGREMVGQIITFGKLQAKAVLKDVGRVLQMSYSEVDKICKLIPFNAVEAVTLQKAIDMDSELQDKIKNDDQIAYLVDIAKKLEGLNRHSSTHAAGVVIGDKPLQQICALHKDDNSDSDMPSIQYSMKFCDMVGLVKFDFLGLKTLTVIKDTIEMARQRTGEKLDIANIRLNDAEVFKMLSAGDSIGVFQIESSGMRSMLRQIKPDKIEDIFALISLYRPGPMDNIPTYIARKHGRESISYPHPLLAKSLDETYGIIVYQEQVMEAAQMLAGYTLGGADLLRKAMGKKIKAEMDKQRKKFVEGCKVTNNIEADEANEIFDLIAKFAGYGFNKAHAASYSMISYQTAYLKKYLPVEFITSTVNIEIHDTDKINFYLQSAKDSGIKILPPDINKSQVYFTTELIDPDKKEKAKTDIKKYDEKTGKEIAIRFGLGAIKAVGLNIMHELVTERNENGNFKDIFDYAERLGNKIVNKKSLESLAKCGALDSIHNNRRQIHDSCEILTRYAGTAKEEQSSNQMSLFGGGVTEISKPKLANIDDWQGIERLQKEFEAFGFFLNNHPLNTVKTQLEERGVTQIKELEEDYINNNSKIRLAGVVSDIKHRTGGRGRYAYLYITDTTGLTETNIFDEELITRNRDLLEAGKQIVIECTIRKDEGGIRILVNEIKKLNDFINNTKAGSLKKVIDTNFRRGGENWNGNSDNYLKKADPIISKKQSTINRYNKISMSLTSEQAIFEIQNVLEKARIPENTDNIQATKIFIIIKNGDEEAKVKLEDKYLITDIEKNRLKNIRGVEKISVEI